MDFTNMLRLKSLFQPNIPLEESFPTMGMDNNPSPMPVQQEMNPMDRLNQLYTPEHTATDAYNQLASAYPTREKPSLGRKFAAALMNLGGLDGQEMLDRPFNNQVEDWKNRLNPAMNAANLERYSNSNERLLANNVLVNELNNKKANTAADQGQQKIDLQADRNKVLADAAKFKQEHQDWELTEVAGGNYMYTNPQDPTAKPIDTGIKSGSLSDTEKANLQHNNRMTEISAQGANSIATAGANAETRGWSLGTIPDPNDPTKQIGVQINAITGEVKPIKMDGQNVTPTKLGTDKPGGDITNSTKTMMEGAQMLRPHVTTLRQEALDLDKRKLFGPVMSRIRNLAAKVGTTGSPEEIEQSLNDFNAALVNDPILKQSNDAAVGRFLTDLGLMTSGMGRVHGGARGGGSIQMINYLKSLLSSDSTYSMFDGRLNAIDDYLKGYAAGPKGTTKTKLDSAIDAILGGN